MTKPGAAPTEHYLAFDLGAESGRAVLGQLMDDRLQVQELHRFPNRPVSILGHQHWDAAALYQEMLNALRICAQEHTRTLHSIGIDTWGVDFALLDRQGSVVGLPHSYRDKRTDGAMAGFFERLPRAELYRLTGVQTLPINTVFQLFALVRDKSPQLVTGENLLFMPDLFSYWLTGKASTEFTFATTSQLYNPVTGRWEEQVFRALGLPLTIMRDVVPPGTVIGPLLPEVMNATGIESGSVVTVGCHDTASAVAAVPVRSADFVYVSSGTWSLMGIETPAPLINDKTLAGNLTNEGGIGNTFRVLRNIIGLWPLQECRRHWHDYSYEELVKLAESADPFRSLVDLSSPKLLSPSDMPAAISACCRGTAQPVPESPGQFTRCILESLALEYRRTLEQLIDVRNGRPVERIHIVGGGAKNSLLCQFTADACGLPVTAGPAEAAAIGNLLVQALAAGRLKDLADLRACVRRSFPGDEYEPGRDARWDEARIRYAELTRKAL